MKMFLARDRHIDADRILMDPAAMTTLENAEKVFQVLKKEDIHKITLITSDYHQMWAQMLFNAVAAIWKARTGFEVTIVGNYSSIVRPDGVRRNNGAGLGQLRTMLREGIEVEP